MSEKKKAEAVCYTKEQLLASRRYSGERDIIRALLSDGKTYTKEQADDLIKAYLKGTVK